MPIISPPTRCFHLLLILSHSISFFIILVLLFTYKSNGSRAILHVIFLQSYINRKMFCKTFPTRLNSFQKVIKSIKPFYSTLFLPSFFPNISSIQQSLNKP
nr:MAG TPA: hypothetical protein [Caudoviricetes sp.]